MPSILHRVGVRSSTKNVYDALTTLDGLSGWWTSTTKGDPTPGGQIRFQFGERGGFDMKVLELDPGKRVLWEVVEGPAEWIGTRVAFDLEQEGDQATLRFEHLGWREPVDFMRHCSTKWATFLMSLKAYVESGKGAAYPDDVRITVNWD